MVAGRAELLALGKFNDASKWTWRRKGGGVAAIGSNGMMGRSFGGFEGEPREGLWVSRFPEFSWRLGTRRSHSELSKRDIPVKLQNFPA